MIWVVLAVLLGVQVCACTERPPIPKGPQQLPSRPFSSMVVQEEGDEEKDTGDKLPMFRCDGDNNLKTDEPTRIASEDERWLLFHAKKSVSSSASEKHLVKLYATCKSRIIARLIRKSRIEQGGKPCLETRRELVKLRGRVRDTKVDEVAAAAEREFNALLQLANRYCPIRASQPADE